MASKKIAIRFIPVLVVGFTLFFFSGNASAKDPSWPTKLNLVSGPVGGTSFTTMSPWAAEMSARLGVSISPESTAGHVVNIKMMQAGQADFGVTTSDLALEGWEGKEKWTGGVKHQNMRGIFVVDPMAMQHYALKKNNIRSLKEVNGKSINLSRAGSSPDVWMRRIFEEIGIRPSRIMNLSPQDANSNMSDGLLHVSTVMGSMPHPAPSELEATNEIYVFGHEKELYERILKKYPALILQTVPAKTYKGQTEPFTALGSYQIAFAHKNLPESLVYEAVKKTYEAKERLMGANFAFRYLDPQKILIMKIPLHPGANKYYEEIGIKIPANLAPVP